MIRILEAMADYYPETIHPLLDVLSQVHNFTIESQVQYHAPLAFEPPQRQHAKNTYYSLGEDELKVFINSAEWTLCMCTLCLLTTI